MEKIRIRDKHPGSAKTLFTYYMRIRIGFESSSTSKAVKNTGFGFPDPIFYHPGSEKI